MWKCVLYSLIYVPIYQYSRCDECHECYYR